jgi:hypothetical protein
MKACARAARWLEEVDLLHEEMRHVLVSLRYCINAWNKRIKVQSDVHQPLAEGITAYACHQADLHQGLANRFEVMWKGDWIPVEPDIEELDHDCDELSQMVLIEEEEKEE